MEIQGIHGQNVISFVPLDVLRKTDIKVLIGKNLRRLRSERSLTQDQLGEMLKPQIDGSHIAGIESGRGVSDDVFARLCNALKAEPWEFYFTEKTPVVTNEREQQKLYLFREEEKLGVAEDVMKYETFRVGQARDEQKSEQKKHKDESAAETELRENIRLLKEREQRRKKKTA